MERAVPRALATVIAKALAFDPADRYQSSVELNAALAGVERSLDRGGRRELIRRWTARVVVGVPVLVVAIGIDGMFKTFVYNTNFGRIDAFARFGVEPWPAYLLWGSRGMSSKLAFMTAITAIAVGVRVVFRILELIGPVGRVAGRVRAAGRAASVATGLDKPAVLAQALVVFGMAMIVAVGWWNSALINAFTVSFNSAPIEQFLPMGESQPQRGNYQAELSVVTLALSFGLYKVVQLRRELGTHEGRGAVAALAGVILVAVLMNDAPYRSFNWRDYERVELAGLRCYVTGNSGDEMLLLCPGSDPPRNRTVKVGDATLERPGVIENFYRGVNPKPSAQ
jgi:hypothetical protein